MEYVIALEDGADPAGETGEPVLWSRPVPPGEAAYLRASVLPALRPLSAEAYRTGPAAMRDTAARFSHVVDGDAVYWCVEWPPGLVVVRFAPDGALARAEVRSPNPGFGGREATAEEWAAYDEDGEEHAHQYRLIFDAWDARFDEDERAEWEVAGDDAKRRFDAALATERRLDQG